MRQGTLSSAVLAALLLSGCSGLPQGAVLSEEPSRNVVSAEGVVLPGAGSPLATLTPETLPFKTVVSPKVIGPEWEQSAPSVVVLRSEADLERFLGKTETSRDRDEVGFGRFAIKSVDFASGLCLAFVSDKAKSTMARVVGIEDQGERLMVHAAQWLPTNDSGPERRYTHVVFVPGSHAAVELARPLEVSLAPGTVVPSPLVGGDGPAPEPTSSSAESTVPRWRAVPNPDLKKETIEELLSARLQQSRIERSDVRKQTLAWAEEHLGVKGPLHLLPESEVWVAEYFGDIQANAFEGVASVPTAQPTQFTYVGWVLSVEDASTVASLAK